jgi:tyrosine-protein kinase Etk/Wzc
LLQKKEETLLNGAAIDATVRVLDAPETNYGTTFPKRSTFFLGATLFAFVFAFGIVYFIFQMDSKIHSEEDFQGELANIPFLGSIPKIPGNEKLDNSAVSRSVIAEATRTLCSNIAYLMPKNEDKKGNVVLFSSSIQGEGKSFCSFHNAITMSNLNKKVLLIGADLRNPQLHSYFGIDRNIGGLSNYLADNTEDWKSFLLKESDYSDNLHVLFSGEIRPNPSQLLTNNNLQLLIEEARLLYDYIIIDSTPVQIVSDAFSYSAMADVTVFVVRYGYTEKNTLGRLNNFVKKEQLKNVGIVINGVRKNSGYGYDYSYNYDYQDQSKKKAWYKRIFG